MELFVAQHDADVMDAYELLISAALIGDTSHFAREDEVEAAWAIVDPALREDGRALCLHLRHLGAEGVGAAVARSLQLAQPRKGATGLDALVRALAPADG